MRDKFDGKTYRVNHDHDRLVSCFECVKEVMSHREWITLEEIQDIIIYKYNKKYSITSISARIRDLRKLKFGGHIVEVRRRENPKNGIHEYKLEEESIA